MMDTGTLETIHEDSDTARQPRICVPSSRLFSRRAFQCGYLEAQDVLAQCADVDLIALEAEPGFPRKQAWIRRLMYHDVTRRLPFINPGLKPVRLKRDYDLLVMMCPTYWDFLYVNAIEGWKDHCRTSVCWIDELWSENLPRYRYWLPSLRRFDHVIVGLRGTVSPLSEAIDRRCQYVPGAADALRFTPFPDPPDRVVDLYSVGRRVDAIHRALLRYAATTERFYVHDTLQSGDSEASDHRQHRELYARIAKRSRFFVVAPGKADVPQERGSQVEVGFRYFEGLAAGTVLIGQAPDSAGFRELFDWPDAVIPLALDGSDAVRVLEDLTSEPERLHGLSRMNAQRALLRHDWVYRWKQVLGIAGIPGAPGMRARENALHRLAERSRTRSTA